MKTNNILVLLVVVAVVAGVAWFRSLHESADAGTSTSEQPDSAVTTAGHPEPAATEGELCPEPPPAGDSGASPAGEPAAAPGAPKKLPRVVDLGADKCKACKELAPILEELRKEYEGRVIVEFIDVWKNPDAGDPYKIRVIPTQIFFDADGNEVWRHEGFLPKADFIAKFAELGVK